LGEDDAVPFADHLTQSVPSKTPHLRADMQRTSKSAAPAAVRPKGGHTQPLLGKDLPQRDLSRSAFKPPAPSSVPPASANDSLEVWVARAHRWSVSAGQWLQAHRRTLRRPLGRLNEANGPELSNKPGAVLSRPHTRTLDVRPVPAGASANPAPSKASSERAGHSARPAPVRPVAAAPEAELDELFADEILARPGKDRSATTSPPKAVREIGARKKSTLLPGALGAVRKLAVPAATLLGAGVVAFYGFGAIVQHLQSQTPAVAAATVLAPPNDEDLRGDAEDMVDDSDLAVAPPGAKAPKPKLEMHSIDLGLPEGITVAADKGLLEINTGGGHKIYVDDVFIGRGPVRRVPLKSGSHKVMLKLDGDEDEGTVAVVAGRRVRFEPQPRASAAL
jgi:hypothetical protein